jgi:hypothetical protein
MITRRKFGNRRISDTDSDSNCHGLFDRLWNGRGIMSVRTYFTKVFEEFAGRINIGVR